MLLALFLLFTLVPLLELWLLFQLSGAFGWGTTTAVVLLTGMAGAALARWQGWQALHRIRGEMSQGMLPAQAIGDGVMILVAGVLLITPGVITDVLGLAFLVPPVRTAVRKLLQLWLAKRVRIETTFSSPGFARNDENVVDGRVVDARVVDHDPQ